MHPGSGLWAIKTIAIKKAVKCHSGKICIEVVSWASTTIRAKRLGGFAHRLRTKLLHNRRKTGTQFGVGVPTRLEERAHLAVVHHFQIGTLLAHKGHLGELRQILDLGERSLEGYDLPEEYRETVDVCKWERR